MIQHLVLFKLKPGIARDHPVVQQWMQMLPSMPDKIPQILECTYGWNVTDRPIAVDFGMSSLFASVETLHEYLPAPYHQEMVALARQVSDWTICDFEL